MIRFFAPAALAAALLVGCAGGPPPKAYPHAIITPEPPKAVPEATLVQGDGTPLKLADYKGKYVWLYFGFANCPDVCPTAMEDMAAEYRALKNPEKVQVVFISVDPARDKPEQLKKYASHFHPSFIGATGEREAIDALTKPLGIGYFFDQPAKPGGHYNVSHSNMITVLDPEGRYTATYIPGAEKGTIAEDFNALTAK